MDIGGVSPSELHTPKLVTFTEPSIFIRTISEDTDEYVLTLVWKLPNFVAFVQYMMMQCLKHLVRYAQLPLTPTLSVFRGLREDYHWPNDQWLCWYSIIVGCYHELRYSTPYVGMARLLYGCHINNALVLENYWNAFMRHIKCFPDQQDHQRLWPASVKYRTGESLKLAKSCSSLFSHGSTENG